MDNVREDCAAGNMALSELSIGPFRVTRSNPTHQLTDPTQPDPTQYN